MKVKVNGKEQNFNKVELGLLELLKENQAKPEMISVQLNGSFVNRDSFPETKVKDNDEVDFLYFMGGGE